MNLKKKWPIRKGCFHCGNKLISMKEKVSRTCNSCASNALEGFQDMSEGRFKSGFKKVVNAGNLDSSQEDVVKKSVGNTLSKHSKKVEKRVLRRCRKEGLSEDEAKKHLEGLKDFAKD